MSHPGIAAASDSVAEMPQNTPEEFHDELKAPELDRRVGCTVRGHDYGATLAAQRDGAQGAGSATLAERRRACSRDSLSWRMGCQLVG